ncbi:MAG: hypothetical protein ABH824_00470, partial [Nanoarchaeota archaeon]
ALTELADKKNNMQQVLNWAVQYPEAAWPSDLSTLTPEQAASIAAGRPITSGLIGTTGADYNDRLEDEIKNLYNGMYGSEGAREKVISILQNEFPNLDVAGNIYSRIPDGYEKQIKGTTTEIPEAETSDNYDWDTWKLIALTTPFSPGARTARAYQQEAILAFAYASSGKQMSWAEAQQLASAYIPNSYDSNSSKINKLLSLEAAINAINSTAKQGSPEETQGKIAKQKLNSLKQELGIKPKDEWEYIPN